MGAWPVLLLAGIAGGAFAQGDAIYRCNDGRGGVLYADTPCPGGRVVAVPENKPDPGARERLQRDLEAFERRHAAREASLLRDREQLAEQRRRAAPEPALPDEQTIYAPAYGYGYYAPPYFPPFRPPIKPRPQPHRPPSFLRVR